MLARWIVPIIVLPGTALVFIPYTIAWLLSGTDWQISIANHHSIVFWLGLMCALPGVLLSSWSASIFFRFGEGTPAPWDPPKNFVVTGPYRYVRNPMLSGVLLMLMAESLILQSWAIASWAAIFYVINTLYFMYYEEPQLALRFKEEYIHYFQHVNRWLPRINPYKKENKR